jgi:hypothetical protein
MANSNSPFGFRRYQGAGYTPTYEPTTFGYAGVYGGIAYNAGAIYQGDPCCRAGSGASTLVQSAGSATTSSVTAVGIFNGCKYLSTSQKRTIWSNYWPGSDVTSANGVTIEAYVDTDPNSLWVAQTDSTGFATADIGANVDFTIGTGSTATGISGAYLTHGGATNSAYPFRFVNLVFFPPGGNGVATSTSAAAYNYAIVGFNNFECKTTTAYNT